MLDNDRNNRVIRWWKEKSASWMWFFPLGNEWERWSISKTAHKEYLLLLVKD